MIAAPLVAIADTKPRSIRSISTGPRPVLITCAPSPQTTPASPRFASTMARDDGLEVGGGEDARQRVDEGARAIRRARVGRAKSSTRALLSRDLSG